MTEEHVVVVGAGFAGFFAARRLEKALPEDVRLTVVSDDDHMCYSPLLPEVASGSIEPRRLAVPLQESLRRARVVQAEVTGFDPEALRLTWCGLDGQTDHLDATRVLLTAGSVTKTFDTPGLLDHGHGLKSLADAVYIRDHVLKQLQLADLTDDPEEKEARCTFLVVGAGYAGSESAAQIQRMSERAVERFPRLQRSDLRWVLVDLSEEVLPELGGLLADRALDLLRDRGMDVRLGVTIEEAHADRVVLTDGSELGTHTVIWCAGVRPAPLVEGTGLETSKGRLVVDEWMRVPDHPGVYAAGDVAAVPDLSKDPDDDGVHPVCPPTAQHAQRQGNTLGKIVAADVKGEDPRPYKHRDLGLVADFGGAEGVAKPLGIPITRLPAKIVAKGYHLYALPSIGGRARVAADWAVGLFSDPPVTQLGFVQADEARLPAPPAKTG